MQRAHRFRFVIFAMFACAILLCIAAFSVSFADWISGGNTSVTAEGKSGLFYVEYPRYKDNGIVVPDLKDNIYYLQVQNSDGMSDYYEMWDNPGNAGEKMLVNVYLTAGTVLDIYKGTTNEPIENLQGGANGDTAKVLDHTNGKRAAFKTKNTGYYDFYYEYKYLTMFASCSTNGSEEISPWRDLSVPSTKVVFKDGPVIFKLDNYSNTVNFHIWKNNSDSTGWPGIKMNKEYDADSGDNINVATFGFNAGDIIGIILNNPSNNSNQTGDNTVFFNALFKSNGINGLTKNYTYTIKFPNNFSWSNWSSSSNSNSISDSFSVTATSPKKRADAKATPATTGSTDFNGATSEPTEDARVRNAVMHKEGSGSSYTYTNYVCVSRMSSEDTTDDNTICFLIFEVYANGKKLTADDNIGKIAVKGISVTRSATDNVGTPSGDADANAPHLYGMENVTQLSDINFIAQSSTDKEFDNMVDTYYDNGVYCVLFFADKNQQFFALDITITTAADAGELSLVATASNINHWQRFKPGFGQPLSFYMGGLFNKVWTWDPRRTAKFTEPENATYTYDILKFNDKDDGNSANDYYVKYPTSPIDITLTVGLTKGSEVKAYMLGPSGYRWDGSGTPPTGLESGAETTKGRIAYLLPKSIEMPAALKQAYIDTYNATKNAQKPQKVFTIDDNFNLLIPVDGEYTFHYVGYVTYDKDIYLYDNGGISEIPSVYKNHPSKANFVVDKLYITTTDLATEFNVTFNANGGSFNGAAPTQKVKFGNSVDLSIVPEPTAPVGKSFDGWYFVSNGTNVDYTGQPVTTDMTLYAKWGTQKITVTLNAGIGSWSGGVKERTVPVDYDTPIPSSALSDKPTLSGYKFMGWYHGTNGTGGEYNYTNITSAITLYAHFEEQVAYTITFYYNYEDAPNSGLYTVSETKPTSDPSLAGHSFVNWYEKDVSGNLKTSAYDFTTTLTNNNTKLYAKWTGASYSVKIDSGNAEMYEFTEFSGTHGSGTEDNAQTYIDTRSGTFANGTLTIKVFYDGETLTDMEETNVRITHTAGASTYTINASAASSEGKFLIAAHRYATSTKKANFKFIGGAAADEIGNEITSGSTTNAGWYVAGQFSDWKVYNANKLSASNVEGILATKELTFVLEGGAYKFVKVPTSGTTFTWYGVNGSSSTSAANLTVANNQTRFYVDEFKTGSGMIRTDLELFRVVFSLVNTATYNGRSVTLSSKTPYIHFNNSSGNLSGGTTWPGNSMTLNRTESSAKVYYYDFTTSTLLTNNNYVVVVNFQSPNTSDTSNKWQSADIGSNRLTKGYSYNVEANYNVASNWYEYWQMTWTTTVRRYNGSSYSTTV